MKVLFLTKKYPPEMGGIGTAARGIAQALFRQGNEPLVMCPTNNETPGDFVQEGITVRRFHHQAGLGETSLYARDARYLWASLTETLREFQPDQIWSGWPNYSIALSRRRLEIPYLHIPPSAHRISFAGLLAGVPYQWKSPKVLANSLLWLYAYWKAVGWERKVLETSLKTIVFSQNVKRQFSYLFPDLRDKVEVVLPGADTERFGSLDRATAQKKIYSKWNIPPERRLFLYVGRLSPDKHIDLLLAAMAWIKKSQPEIYASIHLGLVGSGTAEIHLKQMADRLGLNVTFCGRQYEDLEAHYAATWCLVVPSKVESFGMVMVEAGLCGTPVIAFKRDGKHVRTASDEIIDAPNTGLLAEPATTPGLSKAILEAACWTEVEQRQKGTAARQRMMASYNWDRFVKQVLEISRTD